MSPWSAASPTLVTVNRPHDTPDSDRWRTEIGWPVFRTHPAAAAD